MPLSTTQYGYIIDPLVPLTDDTGRTISNGYVRIFVAGTSTPVITYKNFDGATNEETVQLDNSGRTAYPVIGSKGSTYKVCVYDAEHSQETPIKTIDKVVPTGASVSATNIVTGLDNVESPEAGWVKSTVSGTDAEVSLDATNVTSEVDTMVKATAASADYMMPLVHKAGSDPDKKITLGNIFKFVLNFIHSLTDTATEADLVSGNYLALDGVAGAKKLDSTTLLTKTAQNALAGNVAPAFDPTRTSENPYKAGESVIRNGVSYLFKAPHYGEWSWNDVEPYKGKIVEKPISGYVCKIQGAGDTAVYERFFARSSSCLRIVPHQTTWDTTGLISPHNKLVLRAILESGSIVDLKTVGAADVVPEIIDVEIPSNTAWFEVYARAASGTTICFDVVDFDSVQPKSMPNKVSYETGNITMSSSGLTYGENSKRARTKKGVLVQVKKGDVVGVKSGFQMYLAFSTTGSAPYTVAGWITSYTFAEDGYAALLFRKGIGSDSPTTFDELMSAVYVRAMDSELSVLPYLASRVDENFSNLSNTLYGADATAVSWKFKAVSNTTYRIVPSKTTWSVSNIGGTSRAKLAIRKILEDNSVEDIEVYYQNYVIPSVLDVIVPSDAILLEIYFRADVGESVSFEVVVQEQHGLSIPPRNELLKSVNHRGYNTIAPENTLPAYRLSAKMGFGAVETDVRLTSDGKFVCIHDDTVDRTSDGTGNVADKTLAELKALDFGSWKSAVYAGTKIPTYEEFLICCRNLGLKVYVEVKTGGSYDKLISITEGLGMMDAVTFISLSVPVLTAIKNIKDSIRLGYVVETINSTVISSANSLKTGRNEVFLDCKYSSLTDEMIDVAAEAGFPLEVWTVNSIQTILGLNPYVSGVTSDSVISSNFLYSAELGK